MCGLNIDLRYPIMPFADDRKRHDVCSGSRNKEHPIRQGQKRGRSSQGNRPQIVASWFIEDLRASEYGLLIEQEK